MSANPPTKSDGLPRGVFVVGRAVGDFILKSGVSAKGRAFQFVEGQVLAGTTFVKVNESVDSGQVPYVPRDGDEVRASIVPDFKSNGVLNVSVKLGRPDALTAAK